MSHAHALVSMLVSAALAPGAILADPGTPEAGQAAPQDDLAPYEIAASALAFAQSVTRGSGPGADDAAINFRADLELTLPGGQFGGAQGKIFTHVRVGYGSGLTELPPTLTGGVNSSALPPRQAGSPRDEITPILAQAWYQLDLPLGPSSAGGGGHLELTAGKIDPFVFFDGNRLASDESEAFMNSVFVHNPLLDSGGDAGVDQYGFTPGVRLAYVGELGDQDRWSLSLGLFGAGPDTEIKGDLDQDFVIGQLDYEGSAWGGLEGGYRLYAWSNGNAESLSGALQKHTGWGVSVDQRLGDSLALFGRYGQSLAGEVSFDQGLTLGAELSGHAWGRADDRLGFAWGYLHTSSDYRAETGFSGAEQQYELYYQWKLTEQLALAPDLQWISRSGGDGAADDLLVVGLRIKASL